MDDEVLRQWEELKTMVEILDVDVVKNASGNSSAGVRARKGLRELRTVVSTLVKTTLSAEKAKAAEK